MALGLGVGDRAAPVDGPRLALYGERPLTRRAGLLGPQQRAFRSSRSAMVPRATARAAVMAICSMSSASRSNSGPTSSWTPGPRLSPTLRRAARRRLDPSMVTSGKASKVPPWTSGDRQSGKLTLTAYQGSNAARTASSTRRGERWKTPLDAGAENLYSVACPMPGSNGNGLRPR